MTDSIQRQCGCGAPLNAEWNVCRRCGALARAPNVPDEERELLHEWGLVASWAVSGASDADLQAIARNGLVPTDPGLLIEEAERCLQLMREGKQQFGVRLDTLLTRLDLVALQEVVVSRRVALLRKSQAEVQASERRETWGCAAGFIGTVAVIGGLVALAISRC